MQSWHHFVPIQYKLVNNFIHFKLIKVVEFFYFFIKIDFFLPQTAQFDKSVNLFNLVFLTLGSYLGVYFLQLMQYISFVFI